MEENYCPIVIQILCKTGYIRVLLSIRFCNVVLSVGKIFAIFLCIYLVEKISHENFIQGLSE